MKGCLLQKNFWSLAAVFVLLNLPSAVQAFTNTFTNTNNSVSLEELGEAYFHGKGVSKDLQKSFEFFRQSAEMGSSRGQSWVGYMYQTGQGVETDYGEAVRWTRMAAEQGRAFDANRLAGYFWEGLGTPINREEALRWLKIAAVKGDANSKKKTSVWAATVEAEKKQKQRKLEETEKDSDSRPLPALWRVAGPWKLPKGDAKEWFLELPFEEVSEGLATGSKSIFLGETREVLQVDAMEIDNFAKSLGTHADRIALVEGRWNAEKSGKGLLSVGSDDAIKVWVNRKQVVSDWVGRSVTDDEDLYPIEIQKGENQIHAAIVNFKGLWGFSLDLPNQKAQDRLLAQAIVSGDYGRTQSLLEAGADPRQAVVYRLPALELAQVMKRTHVEELLRNSGVKENLLAWSHYPFLLRVFGPWFLPKNKTNPGYGFLLARGGRVIFEHYSGLANVESKVSIGPHTKFAIGSVSKQLVAAAMLRLQEEGKLRLSDPLSKTLTDFPRGDEITLRQLLTHTSGIRDYTSDQDFYHRCGNAPGPGGVYQKILTEPYADHPGRRFAYSNSNYYLAGMVLEKINGENLRDVLDRLFFKPLGMKDTELAQGGATIENYATPYLMNNGQPERANTWNMDWAAGAGGIVSTPRDLFLWNEALWAGKVLRPESLEELWRPEVPEFSKVGAGHEGYACGWGVIQRFGHTLIGHGGYLPPYRASLYRMPDLDITVVALTNAGEGFGMVPESMAIGGICVFYGDEISGTVRDMPAPVFSKEEIQQRTGLYDDGVAVFEIYQKNNRWYWQGSGFREKLRPAGKKYFVGQQSNKILEVLSQKDQMIDGLKIWESYFPIFLEKLPPRKDSEELVRPRIAEYTGRYSFGPYGDYEVTQEDGRLYGKLAQQQKIPFNVLNRDDFEVEGVGARFSVLRDSAGGITGADFRQHGKLIKAPKVK